MRPDQLDLTGACAVVATLGTTSSAAVDPVAAIADRALAEGVWLHIDAAYAGAAAVCPELRHHFAGWERADSIGVNPHKWLFTPMDCSVFFCRRPDDLRRAFSLVPEYLRVNEDVVSLSEYASPLGRRFRALKLWATLRCFGREGLQAIIREHVRLAALFEAWVDAEPGWELCATRHFSLVCFRKVGSDEENESILRRVNDSGDFSFLALVAVKSLPTLDLWKAAAISNFLGSFIIRLLMLGYTLLRISNEFASGSFIRRALVKSIPR